MQVSASDHSSADCCVIIRVFLLVLLQRQILLSKSGDLFLPLPVVLQGPSGASVAAALCLKYYFCNGALSELV